ncbi:hypothetical protein WN944_027269 [Citrus x changshan-huyou]|uniref:Uncharacterized protein n=1 Tax=Citrus x changshan-huyou TaxID=2935761 RepID=A0AAP0Q921_9ROSI
MEPKTLSWPRILPIPVYGTSVNFHISSRLASTLSVFTVVLQSFHFLQSNSVDVNYILPNRSIPKKIGGGMEVLGFSPILLVFLFYISILTDVVSLNLFSLVVAWLNDVKGPLNLPLFLSFSVQVPMTNFFGSVMETIHTDSAYRTTRSRKTFETKMPLQQSVKHDERRQLINSNVQDQTSDTKIEDKQCPFTRRWNAFQDKLEKIELLVALYEQNDKPSSALEFVQQKLGAPSVSEYEKLQAEMSDLQLKCNELLAAHQENCKEVIFNFWIC